MSLNPNSPRPPIAVVGVSALFPGSSDATGFWNDIMAGADRMTPVPSTHWLIDDYFDSDPSAPDKTYGRRGGFLDPVALDPIAFGVPPNVVASTDTAQLLALIVAQQVLDDATRSQFSELDRSRVSVILGVTSGQELLGAMASRLNRPFWLQGMRRAGVPEDVAVAACEQIADLHPAWTESTFPGLLGNVVAGRIANRLNLGGTNCVTDAACASSFSAISMGVNELYLGDSDMVISGGVDTMNDILMYMCFSKTPALSRTEDIRPFSDRADGTMLGEGIGMVALKRLEDAERDGNSIYCIINGVGASSDGRAKSVYAPVPAGQSRAIEAAYRKSGYGADTVELVEAHGTGTVAGDAAEFAGLSTVFEGSGREDRQWCALGTVKSQIGHTKAAAGAAGLIKTIMALHHKVLPPTVKIDRPNPGFDLANSPFHLNTRTRPWVRASDHPRRGSVSSFGFGGSNFHVALSEYVGTGARAARLRTSTAELVVLTGERGQDILTQAQHHLESATESGYLSWLAQSSQRAYGGGAPARLAVVASDESDLRAKLTQAIGRLAASPEVPFRTPTGISFGTGEHSGELALVFPGQGSQYPFMGADLAMQYGEAIAAWDLAADVCPGPRSLHNVVFPNTTFAEGEDASNTALLTATEWAQPAIAAMSLSMLRVLRSIGLEEQHAAGHSFGEVTALHAANVLSEADTIRVARRRGELMAEAAQTPGSMTAVSAAVDVVRRIVDESGADVVVANHNSPTQVVLSGPTSAIERVEKELGTHRLAFKRLPVATAFHSSVVSGASEAFTEFLGTITLNAPKILVHANETAEPYPVGDVEAMRSQLGRQLTRPVRFVEMVESMYAQGARTFVEVGPSSVLTGLIGGILGGREHRAISMDSKNKGGLGAFLGGIGDLVAAGVPLNLGGLWAEYGQLRNPHELDKPKLSIPISGANYRKPYPPRDLSEIVGPNPTSTESVVPTATVAAASFPARPTAGPARPTAGPRADESAVAEPPSAAPDRVPRIQAAVPAQAVSAEPARDIPLQAVPQDAAPVHAAAVQAASVPALSVQAAPAVRPAAPPTGVLATYQAVQQQTAEAHAVYLNSTAQAHSTYLQMAQQSLEAVGRLVGLGTSVTSQQIAPQITGRMAPPAQDAIAARLSPTVSESVVPEETRNSWPSAGDRLESPVDFVVPVGSPSAPVDSLPAPADSLSAPPVEAASPPPLHTVVAPPVVGPSPAVAASGSSLAEVTTTLLAVVAVKTGYPAEMLSMEMELESDLGIDSIKRVEILSAMQDTMPTLPVVDAAAMARLVTLRQIVDYLAEQLGDNAAAQPVGVASAPPVVAPTPTAAAAAPPVGATSAAGVGPGSGNSLGEVTATLLAVVAGKTGYPAEMLSMDMELESDLGIDSIKRVEILSAMQDTMPTLPVVDAAAMARLATLRQIVDYLAEQLGDVTAVSAVGTSAAQPVISAGAPLSSASAPMSSTNAAVGVPGPENSLAEVTSTLLAVVAGKTGYPAEMLSMEMELESDLGIDSIKRVEILSAMQDTMPTLPVVDAAAMARLATLRQIVDYLAEELGGPTTEVSPETTQLPIAANGGVRPHGRLVLEVVESPAIGVGTVAAKGGRVAVTDEGGGIGVALVDLLVEQGVAAELVKTVSANGYAGVVFLGGLRDVIGIDDAVRVNGEAFRAARAAGPSIGAFVTVTNLGGAFGCDGADATRAWTSGLTGLARTVSIEWPATKVKAIDIEPGARRPVDVARSISDELLRGGAELEVGLRADGTRLTLRSAPVEVEYGEMPLGADDVIVASGGGRGVTAATMIELARATKARFVLLGRSPLETEPEFCAPAQDDATLKRVLLDAANADGRRVAPAELGRAVRRILANREIRRTIESIQQAGGDARYLAVDVTDAPSVSAALDEVRHEVGPITGVVHGAGVLADRRIVDKTDDQFDAVFRTKVQGLQALLSATAADPLKLLCVFSSVAARTGNEGQSDYAMANEVLNKVAVAERVRRGPSCVVKSFGWGPWAGGMVDAGLAARFEAMGIALLPLDVGARMLVDEIASPQTNQVEVLLGSATLGEPSPVAAGRSGA